MSKAKEIIGTMDKNGNITTVHDGNSNNATYTVVCGFETRYGVNLDPEKEKKVKAAEKDIKAVFDGMTKVEKARFSLAKALYNLNQHKTYELFTDKETGEKCTSFVRFCKQYFGIASTLANNLVLMIETYFLIDGKVSEKGVKVGNANACDYKQTHLIELLPCYGEKGKEAGEAEALEKAITPKMSTDEIKAERDKIHNKRDIKTTKTKEEKQAEAEKKVIDKYFASDDAVVVADSIIKLFLRFTDMVKYNSHDTDYDTDYKTLVAGVETAVKSVKNFKEAIQTGKVRIEKKPEEKTEKGKGKKGKTDNA